MRKCLAFVMILGMLLMLVACVETSPSESGKTSTNNTVDVSSTEDEKQNVEPENKLSDDYKIISYGEYESNIYEVVYKEVEDYKGLKKHVGIIKNNIWLENISAEHPFLEYERIIYIGKGCFYLSKSTFYGIECLIYNANTKLTYLSTNEEEFYNSSKIRFNSEKTLNEEEIIVAINGNKLKILNKVTMKTRIIELKTKTFNLEDLEWADGLDTQLNNIYEGMFSIANDTSGSSIYGRGPLAFHYIFFDTEGNEVLNLGEFSALDNNYYFENGVLRLSIRNSNNSDYIVEIDKTGKVISSEKN